MTVLELGDAVLRPDVLPRIVGDYQGPFSLGVIGPRAKREQPTVLLRVEQRNDHLFPESVEIDGQRFPVKVEEGLQVPAATS